ncbi:MAG: hypothetical protein O2821_08210 [Chloroflexi bacterium]|nr:hypothetical protein [Chloroflexota bacterium]MDA1227370.1 hypothetical protein [Chloroflexota bacterium]
MVSKKSETSTVETFICWLCGFEQPSKVDARSMRDQECPNCKLKAAFLPRPVSGA